MFILIATLNNALNPDEILLLRQHCAQSPEPPRSDGPIEPLLPIVLTHRDLSNDQFSDDHPFTWKDPGLSLSGLALASCKKNLGLIEAKIVPKMTTGHTNSFGISSSSQRDRRLGHRVVALARLGDIEPPLGSLAGSCALKPRAPCRLARRVCVEGFGRSLRAEVAP
jgi:hypothetical protein